MLDNVWVCEFVIGDDETPCTLLPRLTLDAVEVWLVVDDMTWYKSSRLPAPQYSYGLPGQIKLQSVRGANTDPVLSALPQ